MKLEEMRMEYLNKQNEQNDEHRNSSLANTDN